jgi:hypothetical protein
MVAATPPDFVGLRSVELQFAAVRCWREGFRQWWDRPPTAELIKTRPEVPIGGVRGDLVSATKAPQQLQLVQDVILEFERSRGRKAKPFELNLGILDVHGYGAIQVTPSYVLLPIGLYANLIRYHKWLRQVIATFA